VRRRRPVNRVRRRETQPNTKHVRRTGGRLTATRYATEPAGSEADHLLSSCRKYTLDFLRLKPLQNDPNTNRNSDNFPEETPEFPLAPGFCPVLSSEAFPKNKLHRSFSDCNVSSDDRGLLDYSRHRSTLLQRPPRQLQFIHVKWCMEL